MNTSFTLRFKLDCLVVFHTKHLLGVVKAFSPRRASKCKARINIFDIKAFIRCCFIRIYPDRSRLVVEIRFIFKELVDIDIILDIFFLFVYFNGFRLGWARPANNRSDRLGCPGEHVFEFEKGVTPQSDHLEVDRSP